LSDASDPNDLVQAELPDIPFNQAAVEGRELEYVQEAIRSGHASSGGPFAARTAALLAEHTGAPEVLMTTSCTAALELSAMLLDLGPGDTVIVPSFTFTTTALAYARQGAGLVFCDIEPNTLGLDPRHLAELLDEHVRAVVVVHYAGVACDMEGIREVLAAWPEVTLIEDNAHGLFGSLDGQPLGSLARFAALSFHETKNFVCGEGGALVLNDSRDIDRARVLYDKGTNRRAFVLGQVEKYTWKDTGSSFGLSDVLAAYLMAQFEQREVIQAKRRSVHEHYSAALTPMTHELEFEVMQIPSGRDPAYHMFYVLLPDRDRRNDVLEAMRKMGVHATFHYQPLDSCAYRSTTT
jgi:dTDP-4-amino-4,6-dideoxygalactose transaminase